VRRPVAQSKKEDKGHRKRGAALGKARRLRLNIHTTTESAHSGRKGIPPVRTGRTQGRKAEHLRFPEKVEKSEAIREKKGKLRSKGILGMAGETRKRND